MNDETNGAEVTAAEDQTQVQEAAPQVEVTTAASKVKKSGNTILDVAAEVESLTKVKALNLADKLVESVEENYFKLGGVLKVIFENAWYEGHESFAAFVANRFGFQERKAKYLMEIYDHLVTKMIPWDKVQGLGWTKLKDLARHLTLENVDSWVEKASKLSVVELQAVLKGDGTEKAGKSVEGTSDSVKFKVTLKTDQNETVQSALSKAKAEVGTQFDAVALEMICTGYLAGSVGVGAPAQSLGEMIQKAGWQATLETFATIFPGVDLEVTKVPE